VTERYIGSLIDQLTPEQCLEMQMIVDLYGTPAPLGNVLSAIKDASPEVLEVLTVTIALSGILNGRPVSKEITDLIPNNVWNEVWDTQLRH